MGALLVDPVLAGFAAGDGEGIWVGLGLLEAAGSLVPLEVGIPGAEAAHLVPAPHDQAVGGVALVGEVALGQPEAHGVVPGEGHAGALAVDLQGGEGVEARHQGLPYHVEGLEGLSAGVPDAGGPGHQGGGAVQDDGDCQGGGAGGAGGIAQEDRRAAGEAEEAAGSPLEAGKAEEASVQGEGGILAQLHRTQGIAAHADDMGLGGGGSECGDVRVVQDHCAGAGKAEGLLALA